MDHTFYCPNLVPSYFHLLTLWILPTQKLCSLSFAMSPALLCRKFLFVLKFAFFSDPIFPCKSTELKYVYQLRQYVFFVYLPFAVFMFLLMGRYHFGEGRHTIVPSHWMVKVLKHILLIQTNDKDVASPLLKLYWL